MGRWRDTLLITATLIGAACVVGLSMVADRAGSQSTLIGQFDAAGNFAPGGEATLPESPAGVIAQANTGGGIDLVATTAPVGAGVPALVDANGDTLPQTVRTLQAEFGLVTSQPHANYGTVAIDPDYSPDYLPERLSQMGAITSTQPGILGSTYTEGASFVQKALGGQTRAFGRSYSFDCKAVSLNGSKFYCAYAGDADATTTQADAETRAAQACAAVESIAITVLTNASPPVASSIPSSCTLSIGSSVNSSDSSALGSVTNSDGGGKTFAPSGSASWAKGDRRAIWAQSSGGGCSGARTLRVEVGCY